MQVIKVRLRERGYDIVIGSGILRQFGRFLKKIDCGDSALIITNPLLKEYYGATLGRLLKQSGIANIFEEVAATEKSKSIKTSLGLLNRIAVLGRSKRLFIIAFGGGAVGDLAGFIASIYKRGVPYIQLPTTLLSQVDSAIGGKVAIDLRAGKNLVGAFYQPKLVFSEIDFLTTLPKRQLQSGLSEIIKCAVMKEKGLFTYIGDNLNGLLRLDKGVLGRTIAMTSRIKARIVEQDEFDRLGIRMLLNYGHTIGHAIETASGYSKRYSHGEAISIGMTAANFISREMGLLSDTESKRIEGLLKRVGLPTRVKKIGQDEIYNAHLFDKKFSGAKNRFVLPVRIGQARIAEDVPERLIKRAIRAICYEDTKGC